jgi:hypothetical protein
MTIQSVTGKKKACELLPHTALMSALKIRPGKKPKSNVVAKSGEIHGRVVMDDTCKSMRLSRLDWSNNKQE